MLFPFSLGHVVLVPRKSSLWPARIISIGPPLQALLFQYNEVVLIGHHQLQPFTEDICEDILQNCPTIRQKKLQMALKSARKYLQKRGEEADGQNYLVKISPRKDYKKDVRDVNKKDINMKDMSNMKSNMKSNMRDMKNTQDIQKRIVPLGLVESDVVDRIIGIQLETLLEACRVDEPLRIIYNLGETSNEGLFRSKYLLVISLQIMLAQMRNQCVGEQKRLEYQSRVRSILEADLLGAHDLVISRVLCLCQEYLQVSMEGELSQILSQFVRQSKSIIKQYLQDSTMFQKTTSIIN